MNALAATTNSTASFGSTPALRGSAGVFTLRSPASRVIVAEPVRLWAEEAKAKLNELVHLPNGWDGYRGRPVSFQNASFALRMLEAVCASDAPPPQIVPGADGDLQIEWHADLTDIELHVRGPNDVHAWRLSAGTGDEEELKLTTDFTVVSRWITELAGQKRAFRPAAA